MMGLLGAVIIASLLGSLHCVGMCGPMAMLSIGSASSARPSRHEFAIRLMSYHLGRLLTYLSIGAMLASAAMVLESGGAAFGWSGIAARLAGGLLVAIGLWNLTKLIAPQIVRPGHSQWSLMIAQWLAGFRQGLHRLPPSARSFAIGMLTTLLPCGWLYVFALVAGGTASPLTAMMVMTAFWLGTLPALTAVAGGVARLGPATGWLWPWLVASLLIATGCYTATGRAATDLSPLARQAAAIAGTNSFVSGQETLNSLKAAPLPCCRNE